MGMKTDDFFTFYVKKSNNQKDIINVPLQSKNDIRMIFFLIIIVTACKIVGTLYL